MCAITFLKDLSHILSFAHFKGKGYILYSKLLLQWAVRINKFSRVQNLKKLYFETFKYHIEKKKRFDYFRSKKAKKNISSKKKIWLNLSWNEPYILLNEINIYILLN